MSAYVVIVYQSNGPVPIGPFEAPEIEDAWDLANAFVQDHKFGGQVVLRELQSPEKFS